MKEKRHETDAAFAEFYEAEARRHAINNQNKIYGAAAIKQALQKQKRDYGKDALSSIADKPHSNSKAADRRRRQMERAATKEAGHV